MISGAGLKSIIYACQKCQSYCQITFSTQRMIKQTICIVGKTKWWWSSCYHANPLLQWSEFESWDRSLKQNLPFKIYCPCFKQSCSISTNQTFKTAHFYEYRIGPRYQCLIIVIYDSIVVMARKLKSNSRVVVYDHR